MNWVLVLVITGGLGATVAFLGVARSRARRGEFSSIAGAPLAIFDELYQPSAYQAKILLEERRDATAAIPSPVDPGFQGNLISLDLSGREADLGER